MLSLLVYLFKFIKSPYYTEKSESHLNSNITNLSVARGKYNSVISLNNYSEDLR